MEISICGFSGVANFSFRLWDRKRISMGVPRNFEGISSVLFIGINRSSIPTKQREGKIVD
jgi:hypothetical protein